MTGRFVLFVKSNESKLGITAIETLEHWRSLLFYNCLHVGARAKKYFFYDCQCLILNSIHVDQCPQQNLKKTKIV